MKNKFIYLILIIIITAWPLLASANGGVIKPLPNGDWMPVDEDSQQAFINYEKGIEKLIIAVDIKKEDSDIVWIIPIPSKPEKVEIDIISELPFFFGDDVISKAAILIFTESLPKSYFGGLLGQIWTTPFLLTFLSLPMGGGSQMESLSDDLVSIETHTEKAGMVAEVITAKDGQSIYNYFSQKGFNIKQGGIPELDTYLEKDYSFVVSWISPKMVDEENEKQEQRGIFISFPASKIYYPLILTTLYGETKMPITIRVLGHVKPEIFPEIKSYTKINYFTKKTKRHGGISEEKCKNNIHRFIIIITFYYHKHHSYPSSLEELLRDNDLKNDVNSILEDVKNTCLAYPSYVSKNSNDYTIRVNLSSGLFEANSSGFIGFIEEKDELIFSELQKFYGSKKPWLGKADYTKISINAPAKLLKKDLWMKNERPLKISFALWTIENSIVITVFLYLVTVGFVSFVAGGLAGLLCFRKFKKYALIGLGNILTLIGLIFVFNDVKKKNGEDIKYSRLGFISSFSIIFVLLFLLPIILIILGSILENKADLSSLLYLLVQIIFPICIINIVIFLSVKSFLNKIGLKNIIIKSILTIILFIISWVIIGLLFLYSSL